MSKVTIWLTPLWMIAAGILLGAVVLLAVWGIVALIDRRRGRAIWDGIREGVLLPMSYVVATMAIFAVMAAPVMPVAQVWESLMRLPQIGSLTEVATIPAKATDQAMRLNLNAEELQSYEFTSSQEVVVNVEKGKGYVDPLLLVEAETPYVWKPGSTTGRGFTGQVGEIYVTNSSDQAAQLRFTADLDVEMPEVRQLVYAAAGTLGLFVVYFLISSFAPHVSVIASATSKEAINQPIFLLLLGLGAALLFTYAWIPYHTFGEDVKMVKTTGMTTIKVLAILVALWTASVTIADEIEGRTALTVLSKPVGRRQFILGKFLGTVWPVVLLFVVLGIFFLGIVSFKVVYDARESSKATPIWQDCSLEIMKLVPGLLLAFFEAVIMAAVSVAVSTRLPMIPNLVICGSIYALGHLAALIVKSGVGELVYVRFIGRLLAVLLPVLDHFEIEGAIAGDATVPGIYLLSALGYSAIYCTVAMLLALILFEDRDLA